MSNEVKAALERVEQACAVGPRLVGVHSLDLRTLTEAVRHSGDLDYDGTPPTLYGDTPSERALNLALARQAHTVPGTCRECDDLDVYIRALRYAVRLERQSERDAPNDEEGAEEPRSYVSMPLRLAREMVRENSPHDHAIQWRLGTVRRRWIELARRIIASGAIEDRNAVFQEGYSAGYQEGINTVAAKALEDAARELPAHLFSVKFAFNAVRRWLRLRALELSLQEDSND